MSCNNSGMVSVCSREAYLQEVLACTVIKNIFFFWSVYCSLNAEHIEFAVIFLNPFLASVAFLHHLKISEDGKVF